MHLDMHRAVDEQVPAVSPQAPGPDDLSANVDRGSNAHETARFHHPPAGGAVRKEDDGRIGFSGPPGSMRIATFGFDETAACAFRFGSFSSPLFPLAHTEPCCERF